MTHIGFWLPQKALAGPAQADLGTVSPISTAPWPSGLCFDTRQASLERGLCLCTSRRTASSPGSLSFPAAASVQEAVSTHKARVQRAYVNFLSLENRAAS